MLNRFLSRSRHELIDGEFTEPVTAIVGNSAADLDSIVGSLAYGYLLDQENGQSGIVFPYLPIPREDLALRTETVFLFQLSGIEPEALIFGDELDLAGLLRLRRGGIVLVDTQGHDLIPILRERIIEVIDHRPEDHGVSSDSYAAEKPVRAESRQPLRRFIVEPVGSA